MDETGGGEKWLPAPHESIEVRNPLVFKRTLDEGVVVSSEQLNGARPIYTGDPTRERMMWQQLWYVCLVRNGRLRDGLSDC
jgi:hypothetical protein